MSRQLRLTNPVPWVVLDTKLPSSLCDEIQEYFIDREPQLGTAVSNPGHRRAGVRWCSPYDWVGPFMWQYISQVNEHHFQYDICATYFTESQHIEYRPGFHYKWHEDDDIQSCLAYETPQLQSYRPEVREYVRKISFTLQLSEPSEYTGGKVQLYDDTRGVTQFIPQDRGTLCIFDSRTRHRVLPVKTGTRYCLVGWALGPRWK